MEGGKYRKDDIASIFRHASELEGKTLREAGVTEDAVFGGKGRFGQALETYFDIRTNSLSEPDFIEVGLELKASPLKKSGKGLTVKERMVLSIINYNTILEEGWEGSFYNKNSRLLIVFYKYDPDKHALDCKIEEAIYWEYPVDDLWIIRNDWEKIASFVKNGKAHELSERHTIYLAANVKGEGHGKDYRTQPHSDQLAHQRSFSLKVGYVKKIWEQRHKTRERFQKVIKEGEIDFEKTFEETVLEKFMPFYGKNTKEIERVLYFDSYSPQKKDRYAALARKMMGVDTSYVEEFVEAGIEMKTIRLTHKGKTKESMSFPYIRYREFEGEWEDSDFFAYLDRKFLFVVYKYDEIGELFFDDVFFWEIPEEDFMEAKRVWETSKKLVLEGNYDSFPRIKDSRVSHVRPHARNRADTTMGLDGKPQLKKSFWLNGSYINSVIEKRKSGKR